jgi:hypothetical protein
MLDHRGRVVKIPSSLSHTVMKIIHALFNMRNIFVETSVAMRSLSIDVTLF